MAAGDRDAGLTGRITLLTDFGTADGYVAAMRGVIAARAPACIVEDASHDIPPGDVHAGIHALGAYWLRYPPGTVHVVVVDPGVGTARRALIVVADGRIGVGPDNGVLSPMLARAVSVHEIRDPGLIIQPTSNTFHGRDIFAPAAAFMAAGGWVEHAGPRVDDAVVIEPPEARVMADGVEGEVVHVDRFGTLVTNVAAAQIPDGAHVFVRDVAVGPVLRTFGDVDSGHPVALIGSNGHLEIAVRNGSAAHQLGAHRAHPVKVTPT